MTLDEKDKIVASLNKEIELGESLNNLLNNVDFNRLLTSYNVIPSRNTRLLSDPLYNTEDHRRDLIEGLIGVSRFNRFLETVASNAIKAKEQLKELETQY